MLFVYTLIQKLEACLDEMISGNGYQIISWNRGPYFQLNIDKEKFEIKCNASNLSKKFQDTKFISYQGVPLSLWHILHILGKNW
jgi:hypothetical protein